jgi:uncharacterized protein YbaP (TraB family)
MKSWRGCIAQLVCAVILAALPTASSAENAGSPHASPALWRVHRGASTVYLFGSMHILPEGYGWTTPEIEAAMSASDSFIFEVPVDEAALKDEKDFIVHNGILPAHQTLRGLLSAAEFQTYSGVLRRAGLRPEQFERYRPWLAAVMVGLAYLHRDDLTSLRGADDEIMAFARAHGKPLLYLETMQQQMALLTSAADSSQLGALRNLILTLPRARTQERDLREAWSGGDAKRFTALLEGYFRGHPEAQDFLINRRNRSWLGTIRQYLDRPTGTAMITVGAAHIGGEQGLIALLCGEGYEVERVSDFRPSGEKACGPGA